MRKARRIAYGIWASFTLLEGGYGKRRKLSKERGFLTIDLTWRLTGKNVLCFWKTFGDRERTREGMEVFFHSLNNYSMYVMYNYRVMWDVLYLECNGGSATNNQYSRFGTVSEGPRLLGL